MRDLILKLLREQTEKTNWTKEKVQSIANKYEYLHHFRNNEPKAYRAARKRGWFDEITKNLKRINKQWTKQEVLDLAKKYEFLKDFKKENPNAFEAAEYNNWLPELKTFLKVIETDWDKDIIIDLAKKFTHMNDFKKAHPKEYTRARTLKLLPTIRNFMTPQLTYWTYDSVKDVASKYTKLDDFRKNDNKAYSAAVTNGWIDEIKKLFKEYNIFWTKDMAINLAKKYDNRNEFRLNEPKAYKAVLTYKWGDEAFSHMKYLGHMYSRAVYSFEFPDKTVYVGLTLNLDRREIQHKYLSSSSPVSVYKTQSGLNPEFKIISDGYIDSKDAQNLENCILQNYRDDGWKILNKAKTGGLGCVKTIWTQDKVMSVLNKYNSYQDFKNTNRGAYSAARLKGFIQDVRDFFGYVNPRNKNK
jgi:hypothetical protein